jgi:hypothetical protein
MSESPDTQADAASRGSPKSRRRSASWKTSLSSDPDSARRLFREDYQSFRQGNSQGAKGEAPRRKCISSGALSRSMPELSSKDMVAVRARYDAFAILDGVEVSRMPSFSGQTAAKGRRILQLGSVALLCGTMCQLQVELLLRDDAGAGNLISLVEYTYCALASFRALLEPRKLPWSCHAQLLLSGVAFSSLTNAGGGARRARTLLSFGIELRTVSIAIPSSRAGSRRHTLDPTLQDWPLALFHTLRRWSLRMATSSRTCSLGG